MEVTTLLIFRLMKKEMEETEGLKSCGSGHFGLCVER